jgi:cytidylate kinase
MTRAVSPLTPAPDAWILDTTSLDFESQVHAIVERVLAWGTDASNRNRRA